MRLTTKVPIQSFTLNLQLILRCFLISILLASPVCAVESNESLSTRLQAYANAIDSGISTYVKNNFDNNHIKVGYNVAEQPTSILDLYTPRAYSDDQIARANPAQINGMINTPSAPSLRLVHGTNTNTPSFVHYQLPGHWIIQSSSQTGGIVFLQPRGGVVQIGSTALGGPTEFTKKMSVDHTTSLQVYAEKSRFYNTVFIHNPNDPAVAINLYSALSYVQGATLKATEFIDADNPTFRINPSDNSVIHTLTLTSLRDRQNAAGNTPVMMDLSGQTKLQDLDITSQLFLRNASLQLPYGNKTYSLTVDTGILVLNSNDTTPASSNIEMLRPFVGNAIDPRKIDIININGASEVEGIYLNNRIALTANDSLLTLYLNSRANFDRVQIGDQSRASTDVVVHGTVTSTKEFIGRGVVPKGGIIFWSGTSIPDGWAFCDGGTYNGMATPDLRSRFIVGANKYSNNTAIANSSAGSYKITDTGGANSVSITVGQLPAHSHTIDDFSKSINHQTDADGGGDGHDGWSRQNYEDTTSGGGSGDAHENRPPYYALAFIMRVK